jgi:hypothetical protein
MAECSCAGGAGQYLPKAMNDAIATCTMSSVSITYRRFLCAVFSVVLCYLYFYLAPSL